MSRVKIGVVVAVVMAALTAAAYVLVTGRLEASIRTDVETQVSRSVGMLVQNASLEALDFMARAQGLARDPSLVPALAETDPQARATRGDDAMKRLTAASAAAKPDFIVVLNDKGQVAITDSPVPNEDDWKTRYKAVAAALDRGQVSKDVWLVDKVAVEVAVAPITDAAGAVKGVLVLGEALNAKQARAQADLLGTDVIYFTGEKVSATSFKKGTDLDDLSKSPELDSLAHDALAGKPHAVQRTTLNGVTYLAAAGALPLSFDDKSSGAIVLGSLAAAEEPVGTVGLAILFFGVVALVVALLVMFVTSRSLISQAEEIELGVGDIINGNLDYVFHPMGADFDGLANSLNVLLARMLGRPEPGEEDDAGATAAQMKVEEGAAASVDPEAARLASEPEAAYLQRVFDEYVAARQRTGDSGEGATLEGFTAKLRIHEANLKRKYNCQAVRFRVVVKDNQVTLKPVPIV